DWKNAVPADTERAILADICAAGPPQGGKDPHACGCAAALPPEQLCWLSRGDGMKFFVPRLSGPRHRVEDAKQLVRASSERNLLRLPRSDQAVIERLDDRVEAHRAKHGHVQRAAHDTAPAPDVAFAAFLAGVLIQRRHA